MIINLSSYYNRGVDTSNLIEISGYGMNKFQGEYTFANVNGVAALVMDGNLSIVSKTTYDLSYTFFFIARGSMSQNGRMFNSFTKNRIVGFDNGNIILHLGAPLYM